MILPSSTTLLLLLAASLPAEEPNLLQNGSFDSDLSGWEMSGSEFTETEWSELDAAGSPTSGSALMHQSSEDDHFAHLGLSQCVEVEPGATYRFTSRVLVPAGQDRTGWAAPGVNWQKGGCGGSYLAAPNLGNVYTVGAWVTIDETIVAPAEAGGAFVTLAVFKDQAGGTLDAHFDDVSLRRASGSACEPDAETLCLQDGRFRVTASFDTASAPSGHAQTVPLTSDTGYLWFFDETNVEVVVKVLDGCAVNGRYWVFAAGLTDVEVELRVEDTTTGEQWTTSSPQGVAFEPIQDTSAFDTCQ
jgi:hypothetical protein